MNLGNSSAAVNDALREDGRCNDERERTHADAVLSFLILAAACSASFGL